MPKGKGLKQCPKCSRYAYNREKRCSCGHLFFRKKNRKKKARGVKRESILAPLDRMEKEWTEKRERAEKVLDFIARAKALLSEAI